MTYALAFFFKGPWRKDAWDTLTKEEAVAAADKARRGSLKPSIDHFCGMDRCKSANGGCRTKREFGVACAFYGTYTWPKDKP